MMRVAQRRLAAAGLADQADELALLERELRRSRHGLDSAGVVLRST